MATRRGPLGTVYEDFFWMSEARARKAVIKDFTGRVPKGGRPLRAGDKSFSNIGVSTSTAVVDDAEPLLKEKGYYRSAAAARTSRGTPRKTPSRSRTANISCGT